MSEPRRIRVLYDEAAIARRNEEMAQTIAASAPADLLVVAVLKGSFMFAADLIRAMHRAGMSPQVEFIHLSSYRAATVSSGQVEILRDVQSDVRGREVLLVDDILESGRTLAFAKDLLAARGAEGVERRAAGEARQARRQHQGRIISASSARIISSSATAWTSRIPIGNCPMSASSRRPTRRACPESEGFRNMSRILVVDDEEPLRTLVARGLTTDGHTCLTAADGAEALEILIAEQGRFDLLLTDIRMPLMDGIALALAAKQQFPDLTIMLMTGYAEQRERAKSLEAIVSEVMTKPFTIAELRATVLKVIERSIG